MFKTLMADHAGGPSSGKRMYFFFFLCNWNFDIAQPKKGGKSQNFDIACLAQNIEHC